MTVYVLDPVLHRSTSISPRYVTHYFPPIYCDNYSKDIKLTNYQQVQVYGTDYVDVKARRISPFVEIASRHI